MMVKTKKILMPRLPIILLAVCSLFDANAAPRTAIRGTAAARQPVASTSKSTAQKAEVAVVATVAEPVVKPEPILNKSAQFDDVLSSSTTSESTIDTSFLDQLREQRAAIAVQEATTTASKTLQAALGGKNACDSGLRKCMMDDKVCGKDFTKCATDGDTIFGDKLNKCRRNITCTGEEFKLFTAEIKADRDANVELAAYNAVIECGNGYNKCIQDECGTTFVKCLGKPAADMAINKCKSIATKCKEQDSGLASRFGTVIGKLREGAEVDIKKKEQRMYKLRDLMKDACEKMGAMFDERSFDCVYTVNFFAGKDQENPTASRKAYAGDMFTCNQEWFGIDVTTFKENAYRETRSQKAASSAMLGAGVGTATGLIASGAMGRALDRQKAEKEVKKAENEKKEQENKQKKEECEQDQNSVYQDGKCLKAGADCTTTYGKGVGTYKKDGNKMKCELKECKMAGYAPDKKDNKFSCTIVNSKKAKEAEEAAKKEEPKPAEQSAAEPAKEAPAQPAAEESKPAEQPAPEPAQPAEQQQPAAEESKPAETVQAAGQ